MIDDEMKYLFGLFNFKKKLFWNNKNTYILKINQTNIIKKTVVKIIK